MKSAIRIALSAYGLTLLGTAMAFEPIVYEGEAPSIRLEVLGTYRGNFYDSDSSIEPAAYDPRTKRLFVVSQDRGGVDVLDISDPSAPTKINLIDVLVLGLPSAIAVKQGIVAVGIENTVKTEAGYVAFFDADGVELANPVSIGVQPSGVAFTPDGDKVVTASTGEANDAYTDDPVGSVSVIDIRRRDHRVMTSVITDDFSSFNGKKEELIASGVRLFGPHEPTVSQDLEPEAIAVSHDSRTAWVTLTRNNALAVVDIEAAKVVDILPFGYKDHNVEGNGLDASDKDGGVNIRAWPVKGMYQPDLFAAYCTGDQTYLVTPNEGDPRDSEGFSETDQVENLVLDPTAFPNALELNKEENLGRLGVATVQGDTDNDGDFDELYSFGSRSFAIWTPDAELVFDSGDEFEKITAAAIPDNFNSQDNESSFDDRSDQRGPEPEVVAVGEIETHHYAFTGLEQIGGVMVYDISNPWEPEFQVYVNNRDFSVNPRDFCVKGTPPSKECAAAGDLGPEGVTFIPRSKSPIDAALLVMTQEISDTTTIYRVDRIIPQEH